MSENQLIFVHKFRYYNDFVPINKKAGITFAILMNAHLHIYKAGNILNFKISRYKIIITTGSSYIKRKIDNSTTQSYLNIYRVNRYAITIIYMIL